MGSSPPDLAPRYLGLEIFWSLVILSPEKKSGEVERSENQRYGRDGDVSEVSRRVGNVRGGGVRRGDPAEAGL